MLVDRGLISLDEPVATYWPEFAQNGKERLPVRYIFSHTSGLPGLDGMPSFDVLGDSHEATSRLAAQKPWWEPGTKCGYQAMTYGLLIGELVHRTTGRTISQFFRDEIGDPLEIDFHLGLPESEWSRPAQVNEDFKYEEAENKSSTYHRAMGYMMEDEAMHQEMTVGGTWRMSNSSGNGVGNARSLAKVGSLLALGGFVNGKRYFSETTGKLPYQEQNYVFDKVICAPVRWGLGFGLASKEIPLPFEKAFHWGGSGGSAVVMVPEYGASWAYVPNNFTSGGAGDDPRGRRVTDEIINCLQNLGG
jgi:CubicO group peptidase (beta-lactamase class C family)